jgi:L-threonylcarbamoyladenylate synthase
VLRALRSGQTVVLPTDTVYGLAALPEQHEAIEQIFVLKERPAGMHLAVLVSAPGQVDLLVSEVPAAAMLVMEAFWPGPLTVVLGNAHASLDHLGSGDRTIGVRCPDDAFVRSVAAEVGPIAATSANLHGQPTPIHAPEICMILPDVGLVVDGGQSSGGVASTVVSFVDDQLVVLREGPISAEAINAVIRR